MDGGGSIFYEENKVYGKMSDEIFIPLLFYQIFVPTIVSAVLCCAG